MAGSITHHKLGIELYDKLNIKLNKDLFILACQGHDLLFFIKLKDLPKSENNSKIVKVLQDNDFDKLVKEYLKVIGENNNDIDLKSFLYGYIVHHIVDSCFHPYIIYETGDYKHTEETKKYYGKHHIMESIIDSLMVPDINNIHKTIPKIKNNKKLKTKTEEVFYDVYNINNVGNLLVNNMKNVKGFLRFYREDKTGMKRLGYLIIDKILDKRYEFLSFHYPKGYLSLDLNQKKDWYNPVDNKKHYSSIMDLYNESLNKAYEIIKKIDESLENKKTADINLNISAVHGYECNKNYELKYFRF